MRNLLWHLFVTQSWMLIKQIHNHRFRFQSDKQSDVPLQSFSLCVSFSILKVKVRWKNSSFFFQEPIRGSQILVQTSGPKVVIYINHQEDTKSFAMLRWVSKLWKLANSSLVSVSCLPNWGRCTVWQHACTKEVVHFIWNIYGGR